jgi:short-subunit dehydrogenase
MVSDRNLVGLVNNAGIVVRGPLLYLRPSEYRRQLDLNMISPLVVSGPLRSCLVRIHRNEHRRYFGL